MFSKGCRRHGEVSYDILRDSEDLGKDWKRKGRASKGFMARRGGLRRTASRQTLTPASGYGVVHAWRRNDDQRQVSWLSGRC